MFFGFFFLHHVQIVSFWVVLFCFTNVGPSLRICFVQLQYFVKIYTNLCVAIKQPQK